MLYKIQYTIKSISSNPRLIRIWIRHLLKVIDYLNNYPTHFIRESDSSKWRLVPLEVILLKKVESKLLILSKRPIGKDKITLKKDDSVCHLLINTEWKGKMKAICKSTDLTFSPSIHKIQKIIVSKNKFILYYLKSDEFLLKWRFVRKKLMLIADPKKIKYLS